MAVKKKTVKKSPAKRAVAKPVAKKVAAARKPVKKAAVKRVTTKKATTKKAVAKKAIVKKASGAKVATRKATTKKAAVKKTAKKVVKKSTSSRTVATKARYSVPEVPVRKPSSTNLGAVADIRRPIDSKPAADTSSQYESTERKRPTGILLTLLILVGAAFAFYSFSGNSNSATDTSNEAAVTASPTPETTPTESAAPTPSPTKSMVDPVEPSFKLSYLYNSIGITMSFADVRSLGSAKSIQLIAESSQGTKTTLGTFSGSTQSVRIAKIDTVGQTKFTAVAKLADGSSIKSETLAIRGAFEAE